MVGSLLGYVVFSLLGRQPGFELDRMLHRGKYAGKEDSMMLASPVRDWKNTLGFSSDFTRDDKVIFFKRVCIYADFPNYLLGGNVLAYGLWHQ